MDVDSTKKKVHSTQFIFW